MREKRSPWTGQVLLRLATLGALLALAESAAAEETSAPAHRSRADEIEDARRQLRERISRVCVQWTVVSVDRPDAPFDTAEKDRPRSRIEYRWADDGRYFVHMVEMDHRGVRRRRAACCDGGNSWRAAYPDQDSDFEHPRRVNWERGRRDHWDVDPLPLLPLGFGPHWLARNQARMAIGSPRQVLGEEAIDGELRVRCGEEGKSEEVCSSEYGWELVAAVQQYRKVNAHAQVVGPARRELAWSDFVEAEAGLWVPHRGRANWLREEEPSYAIWRLDAIEINPELQNEDFRLQIAPETPIYIGNTLHQLPDGKPLAEDAPLPTDDVADDTDQWKWNLGLGAACLLALIGILRWRRWA